LVYQAWIWFKRLSKLCWLSIPIVLIPRVLRLLANMRMRRLLEQYAASHERIVDSRLASFKHVSQFLLPALSLLGMLKLKPSSR